MNIVFYSAPMSSATPVASALDELQVPHERVVFDLAEQRHKTPEFLALNPNGKVPTLVVDGAPMFEALAILQWLGDRFGVARGLWPAADSPARLRALSWSAWSYVTYGAALGRLNTAQSPHVPAALHNPALAAHTRAELAGLLTLLDGELARAPYLLGAEFSLLDLIVSSVVLYGTFCGAAVDAHPQVAAWSTRCAQRPSIARAWGR